MLKFKALSFAVSLVASIAILNPSSIATAEDLAVPKTSFAVCDETHLTYCVESVSVKSLGGTAEALTFTPTGTALTGNAPLNPSLTPGFPGTTNLAGTWTSGTWGANGHADAGYDGLYVDAKAANQWSNFLTVNVRPVIVDADKAAKNSVSAAGATSASSLNINESVTVKIRTGLFKSGVSIGIATTYTTTQGTDTNGNTLTITATPTEVPVASASSQCLGEKGVATYKANQLMITYAPTNDPTGGFGVDGMTGNMTVATNGACLASTPTWNSAASQLVWTVAAPHFAPDGTTINKGFYKAVIPAVDAGLLWGLTDIKAAARALVVSVTEDNGEPSTAINSISVKGDKIYIEASGFKYSKPTIKIKKNAKYKGFANRKNLRCEKAGKIYIYKGYVCPAGYKISKK